MTMQMDLHPQYIIDDNGNKTSVVLPIEEYQELIEQYQYNDLSHLTDEIEKGFSSELSTKSHNKIFQNLRQRYQ